ncbi:MAG: hypothetical protein ABJB47_11865 [Actinomycetota bacterium]
MAGTGEVVPIGGAAGQDVPGQLSQLPTDLSNPDLAGRRRSIKAARQAVGKSGSVTWGRARSAGRWLADQVIEMAPRITVRDAATLRAQYPGLTPEELADALIRSAGRTAAGVGAVVGAAAVLPVPPAMPVEIATETLALVGIELKLIAELHEVYGLRPPGAVPERMMAYVGSWARRRGLAIEPTGFILAMGSPLRRQLQRRLLGRAGRSATSMGPLLTGVVVGAALNRHETHRLGGQIRDDLRQRSPSAAHWPSLHS